MMASDTGTKQPLDSPPDRTSLEPDVGTEPNRFQANADTPATGHGGPQFVIAPPQAQEPALLKWLAASQVLLVASGLVLYASLTIAYRRFYERLDISPDDVGLGYANTLARSSGLMIILVFILILVVTPTAIIWLERKRQKRSPSRNETEQDSKGSVDRGRDAEDNGAGTSSPASVPSESPKFGWINRTLKLVAVMVTLAVSLSSFLQSVSFLTDRKPPTRSTGSTGSTRSSPVCNSVQCRAEQVKRGETVSPLRLSFLTLLDIRATPARVSWVGQAPAIDQGLDPTKEKCALFLGGTNDAVILYSPNQHATIRVPTSSVVVTIGKNASFSSLCKQP
jgi:hypothetical protein